MIFQTDNTILPFRRDPQTEAFAEWRQAERLVSERWAGYKTAAPGLRAHVFKAYVAALDAEEAAANHLSRLVLAEAA
jgi:hypothetical protein